MTELIPGDVTAQQTTNLEFDDDERKNPVTQAETDGGPRNMRVEIGPGFYSAPIEGERVHGVEYDGVLYVIGGTNIEALESIAPAVGERGVFCVKDGAIVAHMKMSPDGTVTIETEQGNILIEDDGTVSINNGNLKVLK